MSAIYQFLNLSTTTRDVRGVRVAWIQVTIDASALSPAAVHRRPER